MTEPRADEFHVDLPFLLQQAAWLYERQLLQVKAQLRKVSKPSLTAQSPTLSAGSGSGVAGGHAMARTSSGGMTLICIVLEGVFDKNQAPGCPLRSPCV